MTYMSAVSILILVAGMGFAGEEVPSRPTLTTPIMFHCGDCEDGCGQTGGHEAPIESTGPWGMGHGHHPFCWEGASCDDKHGECEPAPVPVADFTDVLEKARLAATAPTRDALSALPAEYLFYVSFNEERRSIQVRSQCKDKGSDVIANFPAAWAVSAGTTP